MILPLCELAPTESLFWLFLFVFGYGFVRFAITVYTGNWPGVGKNIRFAKAIKPAALFSALVFAWILTPMISQKFLGTCGY
ncbi:hypothetical protein NL53_02950 [Vibrio variabilis]|uniref:Uncharacterized protein n=1 Tax=Vibrio variabilis TaxID=990271 RepID=A0ABR4YGX4_9VIBR|nr:hypothetical protein NL53_02950 [Vibrio variabilis]